MNKFRADAESNLKTQKESSVPSFSSGLVQEDSLWVYAGLVAALLVMAFVQVSAIYHMVLCSSRDLHQQLLGAIMQAPFQFFEDTKDRILKLFSSDTGVTDEILTMYTYLLTIVIFHVFLFELGSVIN